MELGNELREGLTTLRRFHYLNSQRLPSLYHIKLNAVDVMTNSDLILFHMEGTLFFSPIGRLTHLRNLGF
jgi:hypothetical protein